MLAVTRPWDSPVRVLALGHDTSLLAIGTEWGNLYVSHGSPLRELKQY